MEAQFAATQRAAPAPASQAAFSATVPSRPAFVPAPAPASRNAAPAAAVSSSSSSSAAAAAAAVAAPGSRNCAVQPMAHFRRVPANPIDRLPSESHHMLSKDFAHRSALATGVFTSAARSSFQPAAGSAAHAVAAPTTAAPPLGIDASVRAGFMVPVSEHYAAPPGEGGAKWDFRSRSFSEISPFLVPRTTSETVWRRKPGAHLPALQPTPHHPDHAGGHPALALSQYRSNYPTSSHSFSRQDVLIAPEVAARLAANRHAARRGLPGDSAAASAVAAAAASGYGDSLGADGGETVATPALVAGLTGTNPMLMHLDDPLTGLGPGAGTGVLGAPYASFSASPAAAATAAALAAAAAASNSVWRSTAAASANKGAATGAKVGAGEALGLLGVSRGRDPTDIPTGYRVVDRAGAPSYENVRVATLDVPFTSQALVKQYAAEMDNKEARWAQQKSEMARVQYDNVRNSTAAAAAAAPVAVTRFGAAVSARAGSGSLAEDAAAAGVEPEAVAMTSSFETADLVARHRSLPRPPPPHPMYETTNMKLGRNVDDPIAKHYVYFPQARDFSKSLMLLD